MVPTIAVMAIQQGRDSMKIKDMREQTGGSYGDTWSMPEYSCMQYIDESFRPNVLQPLPL